MSELMNAGDQVRIGKGKKVWTLTGAYLKAGQPTAILRRKYDPLRPASCRMEVDADRLVKETAEE